MSKFLLTLTIFLLGAFSGFASDLASELDTFLNIECSLKPIQRGQGKYESRRSGRSSYTHMHVEESTSSNWSGYAAVTSLHSPANNAVTDVQGRWIVPHLSATPNTSYSSIWVGIDGYASGTVEQIGTEHDWVNGSQQDYAWFEMYPSGAYEIVGFPCAPGDHMGAEVKYIGSNTFQLTLTNYTHNVYTVIPYSYTRSSQARRSSAEWIVEAPYYNGVLPLADFGTVPFSNCQATINNIVGPIKSSRWAYDPLTMVTSTKVPKSIPSALSQNGTAFTVTWAHE